jgi:ketosteroid isomerase-like protein
VATTSQVIAPPPAARDASIVMSTQVDTVARSFAQYAAAFQTLDAAAVLAYLHVPCMFIDNSGVRVLDDREEITAFMARLMGDLKSRGFHHSVMTRSDIHVLSENTALVSVSRTRYTTTGQEMHRAGETYTLRRADEGWAIVVAVVHDAAATVGVSR